MAHSAQLAWLVGGVHSGETQLSRRHWLFWGVVAGGFSAVIAVSALILVNGRVHSTANVSASEGISARTTLGADAAAYFDSLRAIGEEIRVTTEKNAAGDFAPLPPEMREDLTDEDVVNFQKGVQQRAKKDLEAMSQQYPTAEETSKAAFELEQKRLSEPATVLYLRAAELKPDLAEAHAGLGRTLQAAGHTEEAIRALRMAVKLSPSRPGWLVDLGLSLYTNGQFDEAAQMYNKAIELKPDLARAFYNRAVVYWRKAEYDQAWRDVEQCRKLGSEPPKSFIGRLERDSGRTLTGQGGAASPSTAPLPDGQS